MEAERNPFIARHKVSGLDYYVQEVAGGFMFTLNDGRTLGSSATLPTDEFWSLFECNPEVR